MEKCKIQSEMLFITPEMARNFWRNNISNRKYYDHIAEWYASQMRKGQWTLSGQSISISDKGELIDGQHRISAIIKANMGFWFLVAYGVPSTSFVNYDSGKIRSTRDAFEHDKIPNATNIVAIMGNYNALNKNQIAFAGYGNTQGGTYKGYRIKDKGKFSNMDMMELYYSNSELFQEILRISTYCIQKKKFLSGSQIGGIMYYLINDKMHPKEVVYDFFKQLFTNENVKNKTIYVLREKLIDDGLSQYKMMPRMKYVFIVKTWNAYISGKEYKRITYSENDNFIQFL